MRSDRDNPVDYLVEHGLDYSLRRYFVDRFNMEHAVQLPKDARILNVGGARDAKRGIFDLDRYGLAVTHLDLMAARRPHVQADAARMPFGDACFDAAFCSEVLEHVSDPRTVLQEIHRVLGSGGILLLCAPFLNRIHADPDDFARYTGRFWARTLERLGFTSIATEQHGLFWSVLVDMIRDAAYESSFRGWLRPRPLRIVASKTIGLCKKKALDLDRKRAADGDSVHRAYTTGFGVRAVKR